MITSLTHPQSFANADRIHNKTHIYIIKMIPKNDCNETIKIKFNVHLLSDWLYMWTWLHMELFPRHSLDISKEKVLCYTLIFTAQV